ncbi:MAG: hypothetical protein NTY38_12835 [Acidobacteria bacterium]|nr:hypothetical protein [Acidobacteriota bacterium]
MASGMNALANAVFGGWDLSTITLIQSGSFMTPRMNGFFDQSNTDMASRSGATRPNRIGDGNLAGPTPNRWFDINAFTLPAAGCGCFGNAGVGILRGPGTIAVAGGLFKTFPITEKLRMRFEATFTNLPNHPNFAPPSGDVTTPVSFGKITSVQYQENSGNRTGQVGIRLDF